jgi:Fe-Mn family superoxide dismutase
MIFRLPELTYRYDALEPHIDARTMEIHHNKHHGEYVKKLNKVLEDRDQFQGKEIVEIIFNIQTIPEEIRTAVRNNGGGHFNHSLLWKLMGPNGGGKPQGELAEAINKEFHHFAAFQKVFNDAAISRFGSGWAWLCYKEGQLSVCSTPNQDSPLMDIYDYQGIPILGIDVWEHAYYLQYQNHRANYIAAFWNVVNWEAVANFYKAAPELEERINRLAPI